MTIDGMAWRTDSAMVRGISLGYATSNWPTWSAATRVARSVPITYRMPSRYGRPLMQ